ncbi:MAG: hypothetical protein IH827_10570, partial [Myxococcales bacterium]|nr:hypothetical protein [Myxococcales bacterium]
MAARDPLTAARELRELIESTDGGLKGCVKAERFARRGETKAKKDGLASAKDVLRNLEPIAEISAQAGAQQHSCRGAERNTRAIEACLAEAGKRGVRIGKVLLDRGIIEAIDLYRALKQNLAYKLLECFTWTGGSFRVLSEFPENVSPLRLNVPQLVFTGITKFALQEQVDGKVGILMGRQIALHPSPPIPLDAMRFSTAQRRTISTLREQPQTEDLFAEGEMSNDELTRLLYALFLMGIVVPLNALPVEARSKPKVGKAAVPWEDETETRSTESQSDPGVGGEPPSEGAAKDGSASAKDGLDDLFESLWPDDPLEGDRLEIDARAELIRALIPIGLEAVNELLQQEVTALAGARYGRGDGQAGYARWGRQRGSVYLGDQKVAVTVPRVRDLGRGQEVTLAWYQALGRPRRAEEAALLKVL